jgi:hypothetical protein
MISRIRGEVEVKYVRCVSELKSGRDDVVSKAKAHDFEKKKNQKNQKKMRGTGNRPLLS